MSLNNKTVLITGSSRGIGKAIAIRLAQEQANIVIAAKSIQEDDRLGGTIFSAGAEVERAGGKALPVQCDIRSEEQIRQMVDKTIERFGSIDAVVNNASAISLTPTEHTETKRFDLIHAINVRGTFLVTKACLPFLKKSSNPHILTLSPPLNMRARWFASHVAYTISKYSMSMMTMGWAEEFRKLGIAANSLWPATTIATAAVKNLLGGDALVRMSRSPQVLADAAYFILRRPAMECSGNFFIDEEVLAQESVTDLEKYAITPGVDLYKDLFLD